MLCRFSSKLLFTEQKLSKIARKFIPKNNFLSQIFWSSSEIFVPKPSNEVAFIGYVELVEFALINIQNGGRGGGGR